MTKAESAIASKPLLSAPGLAENLQAGEPPSPTLSTETGLLHSPPISVNVQGYDLLHLDGGLRREGRNQAEAESGSNVGREDTINALSHSKGPPSAGALGRRRTVAAPVQLVRRADPEQDAAPRDVLGHRRSISWTPYKAIRRTMSVIFHQKTGSQDGVAKSNNSRIAPSMPTSTIDLTKTPRSVTFSHPSHSKDADKALASYAQLRRSQSYSVSAKASDDAGSDDDGLDEATAEASGLVASINQTWVFEEIKRVDNRRNE